MPRLDRQNGQAPLVTTRFLLGRSHSLPSACPTCPSRLPLSAIHCLFSPHPCSARLFDPGFSFFLFSVCCIYPLDVRLQPPTASEISSPQPPPLPLQRLSRWRRSSAGLCEMGTSWPSSASSSTCREWGSGEGDSGRDGDGRGKGGEGEVLGAGLTDAPGCTRLVHLCSLLPVHPPTRTTSSPATLPLRTAAVMHMSRGGGLFSVL